MNYKMDIYDETRREALKSSMKNRYGCVIVYRNKIIASGHNRSTIHSTSKNKHVL